MEKKPIDFISKTRMHSSRMRTVRCSDRLDGCVQGGVRGVCVQGVSAWGCTPPPVDRMTDACENITFPQDGNDVK